MMDKKGPLYEYKDEINKWWRTFSMTERWGWTPEQIRGLTPEELDHYDAMLAGVLEGEKERSNRK